MFLIWKHVASQERTCRYGNVPGAASQELQARECLLRPPSALRYLGLRGGVQRRIESDRFPTPFDLSLGARGSAVGNRASGAGLLASDTPPLQSAQKDQTSFAHDDGIRFSNSFPCRGMPAESVVRLSEHERAEARSYMIALARLVQRCSSRGSMAIKPRPRRTNSSFTSSAVIVRGGDRTTALLSGATPAG